MKIKLFRHWIMNFWFENCEERLLHKEQPVKLNDYVKQNKWFLKRKYKEEKE